MERHILVAFTEPAPGQEEEYERWYRDVHLPEVTKGAGFASAQRFVLASPERAGDIPAKYIAMYEFEGGTLEDAKAALAAGEDSFSPISDAIGERRAAMWFSSVGERLHGD